MGRYILNSLTLNEMGIRLLPEETLAVAVELEGGLTDELEQSHSTVMLTNHRLIRYSASKHKTNVVSAILDDIDSIEIIKTFQNRQWAWVGTLFVIGGLSLALVSGIVASQIISPFLMALALALIGVVFYIAYFSGHAGEVIVRAGVKDIKCKMKPKALDDMTLFVQRFYELKITGGIHLDDLDEGESDLLGDGSVQDDAEDEWNLNADVDEVDKQSQAELSNE